MSLIQQTFISALAGYQPGPGWFLAGTQVPAGPASHTTWGFLRARGLEVLKALCHKSASYRKVPEP